MKRGFSLPTPNDIRAWLATVEGRPKASQAARDFGIKGVEERRAFKNLYREALENKRDLIPQSMPATTIFEITGTDSDGAPLATPIQWQGEGTAPSVRIKVRRNEHKLAKGIRLIARTEPDGHGWVARPIRILNKAIGRTDEFELAVVQRDGANRLTLKAARPGRPHTWGISGKPQRNLTEGDLVLVKPQTPKLSRHGRDYRAQIISFHGRADDPSAFGLALMVQMGAPLDFPEEVLAEAKAAEKPSLGSRVDLRNVELLTIDGSDARDFDDAVFAEPSGRGWRIIVAIADVANYVLPNSALDKEARLRGNSTYLPDRAIPMLPEDLSNGLCSLKPDVDRLCLFANMTFDANGRRVKTTFGRGLMRSHFRLTYEQAHELSNSSAESNASTAIHRLYSAYASLKKNRDARGPLELNLPERMVAFNEDSQATGMELRETLSSHQLIEEFMVQANAAAAETLLKNNASALYRVHDKPDPEKIGLLIETAQSLGASHPGARMDNSQHLNGLLRRIDDLETKTILSELILRAQAQARYSPECQGHFGLALTAYTHFTSPIRRYADLIVHRALIKALDLGPDGFVDGVDELENVSEQINRTERRSSLIERTTLDRYGASLASKYVGEEFEGQIVGLNRAGLFVRILEPVLDGFVPAAHLSDDYWTLSRDGLAMESKSTKTAFKLGSSVTVRIESADPATGSVNLSIKTTLVSRNSRSRPKRRHRRRSRR